jgi:hypothetical protein
MLLCIALGAILIYSWAYFGYVVFDSLIVYNAMETWFKILKVFFFLKFKYLMHFFKKPIYWNRVDWFITDSDFELKLILDWFRVQFRLLKHWFKPSCSKSAPTPWPNWIGTNLGKFYHPSYFKNTKNISFLAFSPLYQKGEEILLKWHWAIFPKAPRFALC